MNDTDMKTVYTKDGIFQIRQVSKEAQNVAQPLVVSSKQEITSRVETINPSGLLQSGAVVSSGANVAAQEMVLSVVFAANTGATTSNIYLFDNMQLFANNDSYTPGTYADTYTSPMIGGGAAQSDLARLGFSPNLFSFGKLGTLFVKKLSIINVGATPSTALQSANTFAIRTITADMLTSGSPSVRKNIVQATNYQNSNFQNGRYDIDLNMVSDGFNAISFQVVSGEAFRIELTVVAVANSRILSPIV